MVRQSLESQVMAAHPGRCLVMKDEDLRQTHPRQLGSSVLSENCVLLLCYFHFLSFGHIL